MRIAEAFLVRHGDGPLQGDIEVGEVFAWEPDLPGACELVVVTEAAGGRVYSRRLDGVPPVLVLWNDESRFREACVRTAYNRMPVDNPFSWILW